MDCKLDVKSNDLIKLKSKVLYCNISKSKVTFVIFAYFLNPNNKKITDVKINIGGNLFECVDIVSSSSSLKKKNIRKKHIIKVSFSVKEILENEIEINNLLSLHYIVDDIEYKKSIGKKSRLIKNIKNYYIPLDRRYIGGYCLYIRRSGKGNIIFVKRKIESIEETISFKILESRFLSFLFYYFGEFLKIICFKNVNLFFEKYSSKSEEGAFELCEMCQSSKKSKNYYILSKDSVDYDRLCKNKFIVAKYSLKYYLLLYRSNYIISTEAPMHLNILRSSNKFIRKSVYKKPNVFLQHGIIFMKNLGVNSSFSKGKEAEPTYILVSSEKEKDVVCSTMNLDSDQILVTGIPMYNNLVYNHIKKSSDDIITIMLTWKPYEEHLEDFTLSTYYKNTLDIYNELLKFVNSNCIRIVAHPKVVELLETTDLKNSMWDRSISEVLEISKLLITDYSSVCYNTFYQGGSVIFYQEDIEMYENYNGKLIPDDDEYIGHRCYSILELNKLLSKSIIDKKVMLDKLRTAKFINNYDFINEFNDGKNIDRIYKVLEDKNIL